MVVLLPAVETPFVPLKLRLTELRLLVNINRLIINVRLRVHRIRALNIIEKETPTILLHEKALHGVPPPPLEVQIPPIELQAPPQVHLLVLPLIVEEALLHVLAPVLAPVAVVVKYTYYIPQHNSFQQST